MPYKHNESRRHKIKKSGYKVTNWHDYNNGLRQRGNFTIWFTEEAIVDWHPAKTGARGRPQKHSNAAFLCLKCWQALRFIMTFYFQLQRDALTGIKKPYIFM
jgi:hypothetical protein